MSGRAGGCACDCSEMLRGQGPWHEATCRLFREADDLDEMVWVLNHSTASRHWAWRLWRTAAMPWQSSWNLWLHRLAMRLDPPRGEPKAGEAIRHE